MQTKLQQQKAQKQLSKVKNREDGLKVGRSMFGGNNGSGLNIDLSNS